MRREDIRKGRYYQSKAGGAVRLVERIDHDDEDGPRVWWVSPAGTAEGLPTLAAFARWARRDVTELPGSELAVEYVEGLGAGA